VSLRRYASLLLVPALLLGACNGDEAGDAAPAQTAAPTARDGAMNAGDGPSTDGGDAAARRRPVRLLRLGSFDEPTHLAAPRGDRRRFVVERAGRIRVVRGGRVLGAPFLDISERVSTGGESGLLSLAFARDYETSGRFFVYYTDRRGYLQIDSYIASAADPDRAEEGSRRSIIRVAHRRANHKGGQVHVGPDGMLYAGFGDGGGGGDPDENAQDLGRILGKLIRVNPRPGGGYSIPSGNPFRNRPGARGEIYAFGLRNPYRFSFDRRRGHLTVGDVGQSAVEEIDFVPGRAGGRPPAGGYNFGWDAFEGRQRYEGGSAPGAVRPVLQHTHASGFCSITGGYVIRDRALGRGWTGRYIYGDYCDGTLRLAHLRRPDAVSRATRLNVNSLVSFGEDGRGRVYAVSLNGPVYRIGRR
jgi:glucose/arabinose dehydrogenase